MSHSKSTTVLMDASDWSLCFLCQSEKNNENTLDPLSNIKLRNNPKKLHACYIKKKLLITFRS